MHTIKTAGILFHLSLDTPLLQELAEADLIVLVVRNDSSFCCSQDVAVSLPQFIKA